MADGKGYSKSAVVFEGKFEITDDVQCVQWQPGSKHKKDGRLEHRTLKLPLKLPRYAKDECNGDEQHVCPPGPPLQSISEIG